MKNGINLADKDDNIKGNGKGNDCDFIDDVNCSGCESFGVSS